MEEEINKDEPFILKKNVEFLAKKTVVAGCDVIITDIKEGENRNRPIFYGKFPDGVFKFDLCMEEFSKIMKKYGNIPRNWIDKKLFIKAEPYQDGKIKGLRLNVNPR